MAGAEELGATLQAVSGDRDVEISVRRWLDFIAV
jgi:hypothetical protein